LLLRRFVGIGAQWDNYLVAMNADNRSTFDRRHAEGL